MQKEFKDLLDAIYKWQKVSNGAVFIGSFMYIDKKTDEIDGRVVALGDRGLIVSLLEDLTSELNRDKSEVINW